MELRKRRAVAEASDEIMEEPVHATGGKQKRGVKVGVNSLGDDRIIGKDSVAENRSDVESVEEIEDSEERDSNGEDGKEQTPKESGKKKAPKKTESLIELKGSLLKFAKANVSNCKAPDTEPQASRKGSRDRGATVIKAGKRRSSWRLRVTKNVQVSESEDTDTETDDEEAPVVETKGAQIPDRKRRRLMKKGHEAESVEATFSEFDFTAGVANAEGSKEGKGSRNIEEVYTKRASIRTKSVKTQGQEQKKTQASDQLHSASEPESESDQDVKPRKRAPRGSTSVKVVAEPTRATSRCTVVRASLKEESSDESEEEGGAEEEEVEEETVEKILSVSKEGDKGTQYLVKIVGRSYRQVEWMAEADLHIQKPQLLQNFRKRWSGGEAQADTAFPQEYKVVERVLAEDGDAEDKQYYVKWKLLPYSESTWERREDLDQPEDLEAIQKFERIESKQLKPKAGTSEVVFRGGRVLRDYQKEGVAWMYHNYVQKMSSILGDEMGLGKTIQSVAVLETLRLKKRIPGPFLVVAPITTLGHWQREVESLYNINCVVYSGSGADRDLIREYEFYHKVLLTSYEILQKDIGHLAKFDWGYCIVDEAHRLKGRTTKSTLALHELEVPPGSLLLLTGTPVQNNMKELFGLLNVLDTTTFASEEDFMDEYGDLKQAEEVTQLQEQILRPRLLRRLKDDVEKSIPRKEEVIIWVQLTQDQRMYYKAIYEQKIAFLLKGASHKNMPNLRNLAMELRKLCNHPFLCHGLMDDLLSRKLKEEHHNSMESRAKMEKQLLRQSSGKMVLLDKLLKKLKETGHRVLIFSQFVIMLDLLEEFLVDQGYSFERIDGSVSNAERQAAIDRYNAKGCDTFVFILSTRAGGLGITLTAADTCIIYDSDWNPQNDLQAMARCHRIGQTKDVKIYRLITAKTYEEKLFQCSSLKYGLDEAILGNRMGVDRGPEQSRDVESLLRNGAYDILKEEGGKEAEAFGAENIDQILQKRTETRAIGGSGKSSFSTVSFTATDEELGEVRPPQGPPKEGGEFWEQLLPGAYEEAMAAEARGPEVYGGRRKRKKVCYAENGKATKESDDEVWVAAKTENKEESSSEEGEEGQEGEVEEVEGVRKRGGGKKVAKAVEVADKWSDAALQRLEGRVLSVGTKDAGKIYAEARLKGSPESVVCVMNALTLVCRARRAEHRVRHALRHLLAAHPTPTPAPAPAAPPQDGANPAFDASAQFRAALEAGKESPETAKLIKASEEASLDAAAAVALTPLSAQLVFNSPKVHLRLSKLASRYLDALHQREVLEQQVAEGLPTDLTLPRPQDLPLWWDSVANLHLLIGAHKHGNRDFAKMRDDPALCFVAKICADAERHAALLSALHPDVLRALKTATLSSLTDPAHILQARRYEDEEGQHVSAVWPSERVLTRHLSLLISSFGVGKVEKDEAARQEAVWREGLRVAQEARVEKAKRVQKEASSRPSWSPLRPLSPTPDSKPTPSPRQHHIFRTKPPTPTHAPALSQKVGGGGRSVTEWVKVAHPPSPPHGGGSNDDAVVVSAPEVAGAEGGKKSRGGDGGGGGDGGEGGRDSMPESALKPTRKTEGSDVAESDKGGKTEKGSEGGEVRVAPSPKKPAHLAPQIATRRSPRKVIPPFETITPHSAPRQPKKQKSLKDFMARLKK